VIPARPAGVAEEPERIPVASGGAASDVWIGAGILSRATDFVRSPSGRFFLFASRSAREVAAPLRRALEGRLALDREIDDSESGKTLERAGALAEEALAAGLRRDDAFVAAGGGVATDLVGFAAAMALRGVVWNAVPTTTAGMADAAIGGKTGVNLPLGKNLLGAFHPPAAVLVDPLALSSLPDRDYRAGLVEACKAAWIADAALAGRLERQTDAVLAREPAALRGLLAGAIRVKARIVGSDPRDGGQRHLLNFGHTLGHALEAAGGFAALRHGEAVAWGIAAALEISVRRAGLPQESARRVRRVLSRFGPFPDPVRDVTRLEPIIRRDKKTTSAGLSSVLLSEIGAARVERGVTVEEWLAAAAIMSIS
jgi:3-dehydroquinate synthase